MTRKQAEKILERKFGCVRNDGSWRGCGRVEGLCRSMPRQLDQEWGKYWLKINTDNTSLMPGYFTPHVATNEEATILRLLTAHIFIRETYK